MELTEHAQDFLIQEVLPDQEGEPSQLVYALFDWIAKVVAEKDKQIEPDTDSDRMHRKFSKLMLSKRFFPSFEWLKYFGQGKGLLTDTPLDHLGGSRVSRSSLSNSDVLTQLDSKTPYLIDVPTSFLRVLEKKGAWPINYRHEPFASGEVPSSQLWEALAAQILQTGYPVMHFPEAARTEVQMANPPGRMVRGVLNLSEMVGTREGRSYLDWNRIVETIVQGVRMLDGLVDVAEGQIGDGYLKTVRRIGIGLMGWGEMLLKLETPYGSDEALDLARRLMKFVQAAVQEASASMVQYRPAVEGAYVRIRGYEEPVRNLSRLYVLPETELSFIAGTSPGIEPLSGLAGRYHGYLDGKDVMVINPIVMSILEGKGLMNEKMMDQLLDEGVLYEEMDLPEDIIELFETRSEVTAFQMLEHQLAFQGFCEDLVVQRLWVDRDFTQEAVFKCFSTALRRRARSLWVRPRNMAENRYYTQGTSSNT